MAFSLLCVMAAAASAVLTPLGPEFRVNAFVPGPQMLPVAAGLKDGGFAVGFVDFTRGPGIRGRRYAHPADTDGTPIVVAFTAPVAIAAPSAACLANGEFVLAWKDAEGVAAQVGGSGNVVRIASSGSDVHVASVDEGESYVVVWVSGGSVMARMPQQQAIHIATGTVEKPRAAGLALNVFVVTWHSEGDIFASVVTSGRPSAAFRVNVRSANTQQHAVPAPLGTAGGFIVVWESNESVAARVFGVAGVSGEEITVADKGTAPWVAGTVDGGFFVVWVHQNDVLGRQFRPDATALADASVLHDFTSGEQLHPTVAPLASGGVVAAWTSNGQDGSAHGVFARVLSPPPCSTTVSSSTLGTLPSQLVVGDSLVGPDFSLHGVPAPIAGADATVWWGPASALPTGEVLSVRCCGACDVFVVVYHCPPCSARRNGGYVASLQQAGFAPSSCAPTFRLPAYPLEQYRMVTFRSRLETAGTLTLPETTSQASYFAIFTTNAAVPDDWCPQSSRGCGGPCPAAAPCTGRLC